MNNLSTGLSIAAVEQETGLSKDVLRVWERRYGFPLPLRAAGGERLYPEEQLAKLKLVRRLMDAGMRPGRILALPLEHLMELARGGEGEPEPATAEHEVALELLRAHRGAELRNALQHAILRDGLFRFLTDMAGPLAVRVGEAWMRGEIRVFEEHLFTEQLTAVLRAAMPRNDGGAQPPRVLLTTLPGEHHGLGLLMAEAALRLEDAEVVSLGTQTPAGDIIAAAAAKRSDVVALSFSANYPSGGLVEAIGGLCAALPEATALWCGGAGVARLRRAPQGVVCLSGLADIGTEVAAWRAARGGKEAVAR